MSHRSISNQAPRKKPGIAPRMQRYPIAYLLRNDALHDSIASNGVSMARGAGYGIGLMVRVGRYA